MNVLRSLSGYQMYRLKTRERVYGAGVVRFLLAEENFPRACVCCLRRAEEVLHRLPNSCLLYTSDVYKRQGLGPRVILRTPANATRNGALSAGSCSSMQRSMRRNPSPVSKIRSSQPPPAKARSQLSTGAGSGASTMRTLSLIHI